MRSNNSNIMVNGHSSSRLPLYITLSLIFIVSVSLCVAAGINIEWFYAIGIFTIFPSIMILVPSVFNSLLFLTFFAASIPLHFKIFSFQQANYYMPINAVTLHLFDIPLIILVVIWIIRVFRKEEQLISVKPFKLIVIAIVFLTIVGLLLRGEPLQRIAPVIYIQSKAFLLFFILTNIIATKARLITAVTGILASTGFHSFIALLQKIRGKSLNLSLFGEYVNLQVNPCDTTYLTRISGIFGSPNNLSGFLGMTLPIAFVLLFTNINSRLKLLFLFPLIAAGLVVNIYTFSRGGWISFFCAMFILIALYLAKITKRNAGSILLTSIIMGVSFILLITIFPIIKTRLTGYDHGSTIIRTRLMHIAFEMIKANPLMGVGFGNFTKLASNYDIIQGSGTIMTQWPVHNEYLVVASEMGIPALLVLIVFLLIMGKRLFTIIMFSRNRFLSLLAIGFLASLFAWSIHQMFEAHFLFITPFLWIYFSCFHAIYIIYKRDRIPDKSDIMS